MFSLMFCRLLILSFVRLFPEPTLEFKRRKQKEQSRAAVNRDPMQQKRPMRVKGDDIGALSSLFDLPFDVIVEVGVSQTLFA